MPPWRSSVRRQRSSSVAVIAHVGLVVAWYLFVELGNVPKFVMPSPQATLNALLDPSYGWWSNIAVTGTEIFGGYLLALAVGVLLALVFTWSHTLEALFLPLLVTELSMKELLLRMVKLVM